MRKLKSFLGGLGLILLLITCLVIWTRLPLAAVAVLLVLLVLWLSFTRVGRQALSVTGVGISTLGQRIGEDHETGAFGLDRAGRRA